MPDGDMQPHTNPVDILRRATPTPLRTRFRLDDTAVLVETNDFTLLPQFPLESQSALPSQCNAHWKLIRDAQSSGQLESPLVLLTGELTLVTMGTACLAGFDHDTRELVSFIGAEIDANTFQHFLVPFFSRMLTKNFSPRREDRYYARTGDQSHA